MRGKFYLLAICSLAACSGDQRAPLVATDVIVTRSVPGTEMRAGYLALTNNTNVAIIIDGITSPDFATVQMHETLIEDGIASMRALKRLPIQAGQTVLFERGGKHLMLMQPVSDLDEVTLQFYSDDTLLLSVVAGSEAAHD
jgi:copper(I)-binding protein